MERLCIPNGTTADLLAFLKAKNASLTPKIYDKVIIVTGSNDCKQGESLTNTIDAIEDLIREAKVCGKIVAVSSICPRLDDETAQDKISFLNQQLNDITALLGCNLVNNDAKFLTADMEINRALIDPTTKYQLSEWGNEILSFNLSLGNTAEQKPRSAHPISSGEKTKGSNEGEWKTVPSTHKSKQEVTRDSKQESSRSRTSDSYGIQQHLEGHRKTHTGRRPYTEKYRQQSQEKDNHKRYGYRQRHQKSPKLDGDQEWYDNRQTVNEKEHCYSSETYKYREKADHHQPDQVYMRDNNKPYENSHQRNYKRYNHDYNSNSYPSKPSSSNYHVSYQRERVRKESPKYSSRKITHEYPNNSDWCGPTSMSEQPHCYFCYETGHTQFSCFHKKPVQCSACYNLGHKQKFCGQINPY